MKIMSILSVLLLLSAISLSIGGALLYYYGLVPMYLIDTTVVAVIVLFILSYPVAKGNVISINISTALGVFAPIMSASTPAHVSVLKQLATGGTIAELGFLQLVGFYICPIIFVILRLVFRSKIGGWR